MDRKADSKTNLNESTVPLLDDEVNKEKIELESKSKTETKTESTDATDKGNADSGAKDAEEAKRKKEEEKERKRKQKLEEEEKKKQQKLEKQKKKEEEKELKKKEKEEKKAALEAAKAANGTVSGQENVDRKDWCAYNQFTFGINLLDRDERSINQHVNVSFEDVIGEPDAAQGVEGAYRLSYGVFQFVRFWVYRILMTILSVPFALLWALVFASLSLLSVWILTPAFRVLDIVFYFFHRFWNVVVRTVLDPVFSSIALLRQTPVKQFHHTPTATFSGRAVCPSSANYDQLATEETFKKSDSDDEVTAKQVSLSIDNI